VFVCTSIASTPAVRNLVTTSNNPVPKQRLAWIVAAQDQDRSDLAASDRACGPNSASQFASRASGSHRFKASHRSCPSRAPASPRRAARARQSRNSAGRSAAPAPRAQSSQSHQGRSGSQGPEFGQRPSSRPPQSRVFRVRPQNFTCRKQPGAEDLPRWRALQRRLRPGRRCRRKWIVPKWTQPPALALLPEGRR